MNIEPLEARIAPATLVGRVLTYQDIDGDRVTVTFSKGAPVAGMFRFDTGSVDGDNSARQQLQEINIFNSEMDDTNISTAVKKAATGDGLVNIGTITAGGDLGKIAIKGDLGGLRCGDDNAATGPGLVSLSIRSMGIHGTSTLSPGENLGVFIRGTVGTVTIAGDLRGASITAQDSTTPSAGDIGRVSIGGSVIATETSAGLFCAGDITSVKIGGDLIGGGSTSGAASITFGGKIGSLQIGGSIIGNSSTSVQSVKAGEIGSVKIGGDLRAGTGFGSAGITSLGKIGSVTIGGSVIGGIGTQFVTGQIIALDDIGTVKIGRDVIGGGGTGSGTIQSRGDVSSISIGGSLIGGAGAESGKIDVWGKLTSLSIGGSITGGAGSQATVINNGISHEGQVFALGEIGSVKVGRDVAGGAGLASGEIRSHGKLASVSIGGSLSGGSASNSGQIFVGGDLGAVKIGRDLIGGNITGTQGTLDSTGYIQALRIGSVFIGGSIFAGVDKSTVGELTHNASIRVAHDIGAITVKGSLVGNEASGGLTQVVISARGQETLVPNAQSDLAIKSVSIGRNVSLAKILAGFDPAAADDAGSNGNASIGAVKVGGDWSASSVSAGINAGDAGLGIRGFGINPLVIDNPPGAAGDAIVARIASITIKGALVGAPSFSFQTGFVAQQIGSFKAAGFIAPLTAAATPDAPIFPAPLTGNVSIIEV